MIYKYLLTVCAVAACLLCSCAPEQLEQSKLELADRCARSMFAYETFASFYKDLRIDGEPASQKHYEEMIRISTDELSHAFSSEELSEICSFYESPLGEKLLRHGMESKSFLAISSQETITTVWTCAEHTAIRMAETGRCPICGNELVEE